MRSGGDVAELHPEFFLGERSSAQLATSPLLAAVALPAGNVVAAKLLPVPGMVVRVALPAKLGQPAEELKPLRTFGWN